MSDDYPPVDPTDDDEQRKLAAMYPPVSAVGDPPAGSGPAYSPIDPEQSSVPPVQSANSAPPTAKQTYAPVDSPSPAAVTSKAPAPAASARPSWDQFKPPDKHGWGRVAQVFGDLITGEPQRDAARRERNYQNATSDYDTQQNQTLAQEKEASDQPLKTAQTRVTNDQADKLEHPTVAPKEEEWSLAPGVEGPNGEPVQIEKTSGQMRVGNVEGATVKQKVEKPDSIDQQYNEAIQSGDHAGAARLLQVKHDMAKAGKTDDSPGTWSLQEDGKGGTVMFNSKTGESKAPPQGVVPKGTYAKGQAVTQKQLTPLQNTIDEAEQAHNLQQMAEAGNAPADVDLTLSFFKTMRGSGSGGIRFTQQEQNLITGARSSAQDLVGIGQKVIGSGQKLTTDQRNKMVQVIDMHAAAARQAMDRVKNGGGGADQAQPVYATNPKTKERVVSNDGGKTWQPAK